MLSKMVDVEARRRQPRRAREGGGQMGFIDRDQDAVDLRDRSARPRRLRQTSSREPVSQSGVGCTPEASDGPEDRQADRLKANHGQLALLLAQAKPEERSAEPRPPDPRPMGAAASDLLHLDNKKLGSIVGLSHRLNGTRRISVKRAGLE